MRRTVANLTIDNMTFEEAMKAIESLKWLVAQYAYPYDETQLISEKFQYCKEEK